MDCERRVLEHFEWDLNFIMPVNFLSLFLAQGILFSSELLPYKQHLPRDDYLHLKNELSRAISAESLSICDMLVIKGSAALLREKDPSDIAASIIYFARMNILESTDVARMIRVPSR